MNNFKKTLVKKLKHPLFNAGSGLHDGSGRGCGSACGFGNKNGFGSGDG